MNILPKLTPRTDEQRQAELERSLIRQEAKIGGKLFGPVPAGHDRQFFNLDEHTWIWHEEWIDADGQKRVMTTRYDFRPTGVIKSQDGQSTYSRLTKSEARNLYRAIELYRERVGAEYRRLLQAAA